MVKKSATIRLQQLCQLAVLFILCYLALFSTQILAAEDDFPVPDSIRPAISFWIQVYTDVDTSSGFLHDSENLAVIYEKLQRDSALIKTSREKISADLKVLATGKRSGLTASQSRTLALWPSNVSNERLATAAGNVRWQLGQSDRFVGGLKRSGAYRSHINKVLESKSMPLQLGALPHVESSFHPGAYSSAAATGMWQFVRATAERFMQVDYVVDERLDPYNATYGAMSLLEFNYNVLGTWPLALTAYNHGANGMARAVRETGTTDIGKIISEYKGSRFGFASRNFYPQFLAVQEVENRADEFFGPLTLDTSPVFEERELIAFVDAKVLAESMNVSIDDLERDNPALQPSVWSGTKRIPKGFNVKINQNSVRQTLAASFNAIPGSELYGEQIPDVSYTVRSGDSLSVIADRFETSVSELVAINQLRDRHRIRVGQTLLLPQQDGTVPTLIVASTAPAGTPQGIPPSGAYEVKGGDTLSTISKRFNVPVVTLMALNSMNEKSIIYPGQSLDLVSGAENVAEATPVLIAETPLVTNEETEQIQIPEVQVAQLSVDSDNAALEVNSIIQAVEEREQLSIDLATDPSDYSVAEDSSIEIQTIETLGHYADWLGIKAQDIRRLNGISYGQAVIVGERLILDFSKEDIAVFETSRREFHRSLQSSYFSNWRIQNTEEYSIKNRDFLVNLARERSVPMWLFRQYNPEVDTGRLQIGQVIVFPVVERVTL